MTTRDARFNDILHQYHRPVYRQALRILDDPQDAEEVAQDVLVRVYNSLDTFREEAQLGTWINRITTNLCYSRRRKPSMKFVSLEEMHDADQIAADDPTPEEVWLSQDEIATLNSFISTLPEKESIAITHCYYEDKSYNEIGGAMKIPQGSVAVLLHRGKIHLHRFLADHDYWKDRK